MSKTLFYRIQKITMNTVTIVGYLADDGHVKGDLARFRIVVLAEDDNTQFEIPCEAFGSPTKELARYLTKGMRFAITGKLSSYKNQLIIQVGGIQALGEEVRDD